MTPLEQLTAAGVAVWLDDLGRHRLASGQLAELVATQSVVGVTSNPSIFAAAIGDGSDYAADLELLARAGATPEKAVRELTTSDVRAACDVLADVHLATAGRDGRVSLEVDPRLAADPEATARQAAELSAAVGRPNLLVKIPATAQGLPAVTETLGAGISVNVTLIFSLSRYQQVLDAWLAGLELAASNGHHLSGLDSVASFFVSRMDTAVDALLDANGSAAAADLRGRAALANARLAYQSYEEMLAGDRWARLRTLGARSQRPLWASTGTKDPSYSDTRYVTGLVAPDTVNTMPYATLQAVADHGVVTGDTVRSRYAESRAVLDALAEVGVDYDAVVDQLERDGVLAFQKSWENLLDSVASALAKDTGG
jgi:transaldolase